MMKLMVDKEIMCNNKNDFVLERINTGATVKCVNVMKIKYTDHYVAEM